MLKTVQWLTLRKFKSKSPDTRFEAVKEMLAAEDAAYLEPLLEALQDDWVGVRAVAAEALGRIGDKSAIPALRQAANDPEKTVRGSAAHALEILGAAAEPARSPAEPRKAAPAPRPTTERQPENRSMLDSLIADLGHPMEGPKAAIALAEIGGGAVGPLITVLERENSWSQLMAIRALGEIGDPRAVAPLTAELKKGSHEAARALGKIGDPDAVTALIDSLKSGADHLAEAAAEALGRIGDRRAVDPLIKSLGRKGVNPSMAAEALGLIGDPAAAPALVDMVTNRSAAIALRRIGCRAVPVVASRLDDPDEDVRKACAWILAKIGDPRAIPHLSSRLSHGGYLLRTLEALDWTPDRPEEKVAAHLMHGELESVVALGPGVIPHVVEGLDNDDSGIRTAASMAVVQFGAEALPALTEGLRSRRPRLSRGAAAALGAIGSADAVPALVQSLGESPSMEIVQALAALGGPAASDALLKLLNERGADAERAAAAAYLGRLEHKSPEIEQSLIRAIDDDSYPVREAALQASAGFLDERAIEPLLALLADNRALVVDPITLQVKPAGTLGPALTALGKIGSARAAGPVVRLLTKPAFSTIWTDACAATSAILAKAAGEVPDEVVREITLLDAMPQCQHAEIEGDRIVKRTDMVDCRSIKRAAESEILRRQPPRPAPAEMNPPQPQPQPEETAGAAARQTVTKVSSTVTAVPIESNGTLGAAPTVQAELLVICECGAKARVNVKYAGKQGKCKECGASVTVPAA